MKLTNKTSQKKITQPKKEINNKDKVKSIGDSLINALKQHRKEKGFK